MQDKFSEEFYCVKGVDNRLVGTGFGIFTIIEPYRYELKHSPYNATFVKCECNLCKNQTFKDLAKMKAGISISNCQECTRNRYIRLNDYVSILKIYDNKTMGWKMALVNTDCADYLKSLNSEWSVRYDMKYNYIRIVSSNYGSKYLSRAIVDYVNKKYNLPDLSNETFVDHISGNIFNNLYYPDNDYYNNLRVCSSSQNSMNIPCDGYTLDKDSGHFIATISIDGTIYRKSFHTTQECIDYNNSLISQINPELSKYYYHHPDNPRNWSWTYSNSVLNSIGFNDSDFICNEDFENLEWDDQ